MIAPNWAEVWHMGPCEAKKVSGSETCDDAELHMTQQWDTEEDIEQSQLTEVVLHEATSMNSSGIPEMTRVIKFSDSETYEMMHINPVTNGETPGMMQSYNREWQC